jgi:molybdopterin biosynthesis enzyme
LCTEWRRFRVSVISGGQETRESPPVPRQIADRNKPAVVYVQPRKGFVDVRRHSDLSALLAELDRETARRLHAAADAEGLGLGVADQPAPGF